MGPQGRIPEQRPSPLDGQYLTKISTPKSLFYCRGAQRELGLIRHACLASMLVGDDGLGHVEKKERERDRARFHRF